MKRPKDMNDAELAALPEFCGRTTTPRGFPRHRVGEIKADDVAQFRDSTGRVWWVDLIDGDWFKRPA